MDDAFYADVFLSEGAVDDAFYADVFLSEGAVDGVFYADVQAGLLWFCRAACDA